MAIYHLSAKTIGRSAGRSATAAAAYRAGEAITDIRTGLVHDYTRREGVLHTEIMAPDNAPEWALDRADLWNAVEAVEKRKDAQLCRELVVALPAELDDRQRLELVRGFVQEQFVEQGMVADIALHSPGGDGDERNHHAHIMLTMRDVGPTGFGQKNRDWNRKEKLEDWRKAWEQTTNDALEQAGSSERIDARSLKAQGVDREPTTHIGPVATEIERSGRASDRGEINRGIVADNAKREGLTADIIDLKTEREKRLKAPQDKPMSAEDLVDAWEKREATLMRSIIERTERLQKTVRSQINQINTKRDSARRAHAENKPKEPKGLFAFFKRKGYEKELAEWKANDKRIESWKQGRETELRKRLARFPRDEGHLYIDATKAARSKLERERPEWAARLPEARDEKKRQEQAKKILLAFERMATKRETKSKGYQDTSPEWKRTPEGLKSALDDFNKQPKFMRQAVLDKMGKDPKALQAMAKLMQQRKASISKMVGKALGF